MRKEIIAYTGALLDLKQVSLVENRNFYFEAQENLEGTFAIKIWNSDKKNTELPMTGIAITKEDKKLTLAFDAATMTMVEGVHYFEISETTTKTIYFKGGIEFIK